MDFERIPGLSNEADQAFRAAREMQVISKNAQEALFAAAESIAPIAEFAEAMLADGDEDRSRQERSNLVKVGENGIGESVYVFAYTNNLASNARSEEYGFAACVGMVLDTADHDKLNEASKDQLELLGKSTQGRDIYGVIYATEHLLDIVSGYSELVTHEAIEARRLKSSDDREAIMQTVDRIKDSILSKELNPLGTSCFYELSDKIRAERNTEQAERDPQ